MENITTEERMVIEAACERLVKQFAVFNDFGRNDDLADLFIEDGSFVPPLDPVNPAFGREAIRALMKGRPPRLSRHFMNNILIEVTSAEEATGVSYVAFLSTSDVKAVRPTLAEPKMLLGEYQDQFVKTPVGWRFKCRRGSISLMFCV